MGLACAESSPESVLKKRVYVAESDIGYQLIKDGEPFFVRGACVGDEYWAEFKAAGGNTIRIYDPTNLKEKLDRADSLGLLVAVDIPLPMYSKEHNLYSIPESVEQITSQIKELVTANRDHPALLFWILGNDVYYPISLRRNPFINQFNNWIRLIQELDPDHPVTSAFPGVPRRMIASKSLDINKLHFLAFNFFGAANSIDSKISQLSLFWKGPFMATEWGINGPWEPREFTSWGAPVEQTSSKKAEIYRERYSKIRKLFPSRYLGGFVFYWGQKEERTPTWFSAFLPDGRPTRVVHEAKAFFGVKSTPYTGPELGYILLEGRGAPSSIMLSPGKELTATIHNTFPDPSELEVQWEIRQENWFRDGTTTWNRTAIIPTDFILKESGDMSFISPEEEGPYRLYLYLGDNKGQAATANIPFYILIPENAD